MIVDPMLRGDFEDLRSDESNPWRRGRRFQDWLYKLFTSEGLDCSPPEIIRERGIIREQLDGWFRDRCGVNYIVEAKWRKRRFGAPDAFAFNEKLRRRPETWGVVFSISGFTRPALDWLTTRDSERRTVLFWLRDIETILRQDVNLTFRELLRQKRAQPRPRTKPWRPDVDGSSIRWLDVREICAHDAGSEVYRLLIDASDPDAPPTLLAATHAGVIWRLNARDLAPIEQIVVGLEPVRGLWLADVNGDGTPEILAGTTGYALLLDRDGRELQRYELTSGKRAMSVCAAQRAAGKWLVAVGTDNGHVIAYSPDGRIKWDYGERAARAYDVRPYDAKQDGEPMLVVARLGGIQLLSLEGKVIWHYDLNGFVRSVCCADVDGDGHAEIVVPAGDARVHVLGGDGTRKWREPKQLSARLRCAAVADVDGDGRPEIVAGADDGSITALEGDTGLIKWRYRTRDWIGAMVVGREVDRPAPKRRHWIASAKSRIRLYEMHRVEGLPEEPRREDLELPSDVELKWHIDNLQYSVWSPDDRAFALRCADIDGDGRAELVAATEGGLFVFRHEVPAPVWRHGCPTTFRAADVGDVNGDGRAEIVAGNVAGEVDILDADFNRLRSPTAPLLGQIRRITTSDIDGDGVAEILVAAEDGHVRALDAANGRELWDYETDRLDWVRCVIAADINDDGKPEVLFDADDCRVQALDASGHRLWDACPDAPARHTYFWDVAAVDLDGDGRVEVLSPREDGLLFAFDGRTGRVRWTSRPTQHTIHVLACHDIDGDGRAELLGGCRTGICAIKGAHTCKHFEIGRVGALGIGDYDGDGEDEVIAHVAGHGILGLHLTW